MKDKLSVVSFPQNDEPITQEMLVEFLAHWREAQRLAGEISKLLLNHSPVEDGILKVRRRKRTKKCECNASRIRVHV